MFLVDFLLKLLGIRKDATSNQASSNGNGNGRGRHGRHGRHAGNNRQQQQKSQSQKSPQSERQKSSQQPQRAQQPRGGQALKGSNQQQKQNQNPQQRASRPQPSQPRGSQKSLQPQKKEQAPARSPEGGQEAAPKGPVTVEIPPPPKSPDVGSEKNTGASESVGAASVAQEASVPVSVPVEMQAGEASVASDEKPLAEPSVEEARQIVYVVRAETKFTVLVNLLRSSKAERTVVFCNKKVAAEDAHRALAVEGFKCGLLTGDVNEEDRTYVLRAFAAGEIPLVVVTDGFDAGVYAGPVDCVVNYDFPYEPADYVRRIGNVGKGENSGRVISFADEDESFAIPEIEEHLGASLKCRVLEDTDPLLVALDAAAVDAEPEPEPEPLYTHIEGGVPVFDAQGREGRVVLGGGTDPRPLPSFETALDSKNVLNEENVYLKAAANPDRGGEWAVANEEC